MNISKRFYPFVVFFVCGSVIIYTALRSTNIIIGPSIEIKYPINIYETETPVNVSGVVKRSSHFYINDREIYLCGPKNKILKLYRLVLFLDYQKVFRFAFVFDL